MKNNHSIKLCNIALEANKNLIDSEAYEEIADYINKNNEWGIGIEMLIDILCEEKSQVEKGQFKKIKEAMKSMGLEKGNRMETLNNYVKNT